MSIKPPSDIVMDVALAADPAKRDVAVRRLAGLLPASAGPVSANAGLVSASAGQSFAAALNPSGSQPSLSPLSTATAPPARKAAATGGLPGAMSALETFFLRTAFETMLPASSHVSGFAGAGAGVWKSMLADALANQVSEAGGLHLLPNTRDAA